MSILLCLQIQSLRQSILAVLPCTALVPIKNWRFWMSTKLVLTPANAKVYSDEECQMRLTPVPVSTLPILSTTSQRNCTCVAPAAEISPPNWLVHCKLSYDGNEHNLAAKTTLTQSEDFKFRLEIDVNDVWNHYKTAVNEAKANDMLANGTLELKYKEADSSSGVSWGEAVVVCMDTREPQHATKNAKDSASHTFLHEIGHYVGLAGKFQPDHSDTLNPNFYSELAGELSARGKGGYGTGPHCDGLNDQCIVWYSFQMTLEYCDMCKLFMRARDLSSLKATARNKF